MSYIYSLLSQFLIISFFILSGCSKDSTPEPSVSFTMDKTDAEIGETVTFTNTSQYTTSYVWDFGDGSISTEENPTHIYSNTGEYFITLSASGKGGDGLKTKGLLVWDLSIKSIFDGDNVEFQGPTSFETQPVELETYNQSSSRVSANLVKYDEGYTHQDMLDLFHNGISYLHAPDWVISIEGVWGYINPNATRRVVVNFEIGLYSLVIVRENPFCVWYVAGLTVTDD